MYDFILLSFELCNGYQCCPQYEYAVILATQKPGWIGKSKMQLEFYVNLVIINFSRLNSIHTNCKNSELFSSLIRINENQLESNSVELLKIKMSKNQT